MTFKDLIPLKWFYQSMILQFFFILFFQLLSETKKKKKVQKNNCQQFYMGEHPSSDKPLNVRSNMLGEAANSRKIPTRVSQ